LPAGQLSTRIYRVKRLWQAAINSWNGLVAVTQSEEAFRQEVAVLVIGVPLAFFLTTDVSERFALIGVIVFIMIVELLNTAIEKLSDRVTLKNDPAIKRVKDMGSAAVGLSLLAAGAVWLWVVIEKLWP
jgi:diacylglycerol kinase (ATP)